MYPFSQTEGEMADMSKGAEPLYASRYNVQVDASMLGPEGSRQEVRLTNLSHSGCRFTAPRKLGLGAQITIAAGRAGLIAARVKWRVGTAHGVRFEQPISDAMLDHIRLFLSEQPALVAERDDGALAA
jgi:hypothetical protein